MKHVLDQMLSLTIKFVTMLLLVLAPVKSIMVAALALVIADLITGLWASKKEGTPITSNALRRSVMKTLTYQSAIIISFILETYLLDGMPVVKVVAGLIGITEGKSFFENIHRITGIDFWSEILNKVQATKAKSIPSKRRKKKK